MDRILTIPNAVSFLRVLLVPYFWWVLLVDDRVGLAAALIFVVGSTDWIDGYLARRLDQVSEFGTMLDPVADRLMIASALLGGLLAGVLPLIIGIPLLVREVIVGIGAIALRARTGGRLDVLPLGKVSTFMLYGAIPSFYLVEADIAAWLFVAPAWIAGGVGLLLYFWVGARYSAEIYRLLRV